MTDRQKIVSPLLGQMQPWPLTVDRFLDLAARYHGDRSVVARRADMTVERTDYARVRRLAGRIASALSAYGVKPGDRVGTLAMNGIEHFAAWYGIMGIGAVCHTLNPRLFEDQLVYIINHAQDRLIFADSAFVPILERVLPRCPGVALTILIDGSAAASFPHMTMARFIADADADFGWPRLDEESAAGLCYTSGTTGDPKGVLYSHRSNYLHTLHSALPDALGISATHVMMPIVPMFHANAWGLVFTAPAVGASLVLPGLHLDGASINALMDEEGVTHTAGVPTVMQALLDEIDATGRVPHALRRVCVGGAALPPALLEGFERRGIEVRHAWGMTELSPLGLLAAPLPSDATLDAPSLKARKLKQGRALHLDMRLVDDEGAEVAWDGVSLGRLQVRGPTVVERYFRIPESALSEDGWFDTGDIATIDPEGYVSIADRAKDIVKSGGEWISSVEIENLMIGHPAVQRAAVIAIPHPKWGERPRLYIQLKPEAHAEASDMLGFLEGRIARWWMPDEVVFVSAIPLGPTGKIDKKALRAERALEPDADRAPSQRVANTEKSA